MPRIKVTGYIDTTSLDPEQLDSAHETGLSEQGFNDLSREFLALEDTEFEQEDDD